MAIPWTDSARAAPQTRVKTTGRTIRSIVEILSGKRHDSAEDYHVPDPIHHPRQILVRDSQNAKETLEISSNAM
jgi:hypothetical protein